MANMMQQLEEDDCSTPRQSTTIALEYPSIPVNGTPDSWLSSSQLVPMASIQDEGSVRSNDDTMSSLGDSAYDFIDDTSFATTDDEDQSRMTDSVSVTGRSVLEGPENHDLERTISADNVQNLSLNDPEQAGLQGSVSEPAPESAVDSSTYSASLYKRQNADHQSPSNSRSIRFEEIRHGEGSYPLENACVPQHIAVTVRQHMLDQTLSFQSPYRILYVGSPSARERIVTKIGAALASTAKVDVSGPSRYSIVPLPSSDDPTFWGDPVLLDWSGHEIAVYHCIDASLNRTDNGHDSVNLTMEDNTHIFSSWVGGKFSVTGNWELPDLAIFYLSDRDNVSAKQTRRLARSFMVRHKIPSIIISEKTSWDRLSEAMVIDHLTPHICLHARNDTTSLSRVVKRLPIDISTFTRLDASQLNRNLAYLDKTSDTRRASDLDGSNSRSRRKNDTYQNDASSSYRSLLMPGAFHEYFGTASPVLPYLFDILAAAAVCVLISFMVLQIPLLSARHASSAPNSHLTTSSASTVQIATSTALLQGKPSTTQGTTLSDLVKASTPQCTTSEKLHGDLATLWLETSPKAATKSENFKVYVLGTKHMVLRPPQWFTKLRKSPKLMLNVTQSGYVLKYEVSTLFDGVYALELPESVPHGLVNVSVWTESKPRIHEVLQADFGNPWFHAAGWRKVASSIRNELQQDLAWTHLTLDALYLRCSAKVHLLMEQTVARAESLQRGTDEISKTAIGRVARFKDSIISASSTDFVLSLPRLKQRQSAAVSELSLRAVLLQQGLSSHLFNKTLGGQAYVRAAPTAYRIHLRGTQKRALKLWWSMVGFPEESPVSVRAQEKSRTFGKKPKMQIVRT
ncbi:MAG: hypothetical protein Q9170_003253 [Blastenia crenularia]